MIRLAIFASGTGSNTRAILAHFQEHEEIKVALVASNKPKAGALDHAHDFGVETLVLAKAELTSGESLKKIQDHKIDWIILAGFLLLVPQNLIQAFPNRIINVHPALLPKFGGKGMYGKHVHKAVSDARERETGITVHFVNEQYDEGQIIKQYTTNLPVDPTPELVEAKVRALELEFFPICIEETITSSP